MPVNRLEDHNYDPEDAAAREYERAEKLLHSILPRSVAEELSAKGSSRPIQVESATIPHPIHVCMTALALLWYVEDSRSTQEGTAMDIRIGINTGSVTAGINVSKGEFLLGYDI